MKCGKKTEENQVFCQECLQVMERYPVKPDTAVQLPKRPPRSERRAARKREPTRQELRQHHRTVVKGMIIVISVLLLLVCLLGGLLIEAYSDGLPFFGSF